MRESVFVTIPESRNPIPGERRKGVDEVPDDLFSVYAFRVAGQIVKGQVNPAGCLRGPEK
jgi:hypothetical protein